ncbi:MAG: methyltransferase, partial [Bacteroidota bacterium]|nr:methyltransferase [Bacteroidota bacterium]MDX5429854.1 methyltransferase [Bacteroidota bacterium]MDX5468633.1 methyltransferase [Bacteroidota bacterium]
MELRHQNDYNRLAPFYDWLGHSVYFGQIGRSQREYLNQIPKGSRILFIGGGTGFLLNDLLETAEPSEIVYIEKSSQMIRKSIKACTHPDKAKVTFIHGTQEDLKPEDSYDVILTFFFFDQFRLFTIEKIFLQLEMHLKDEGLWLWADFIPPQTWWQKVLMKTMIVFFKFTTELGTNEVFSVPELFSPRGYRIQ